MGNIIYVQELEHIIKSSAHNNNTETIALIGNWGAGKSSVVKSLETRIKKEKIIHPFFVIKRPHYSTVISFKLVSYKK